METLHDQGFLIEPPKLTQDGVTFSLSAKGWIELDRITRSGSESTKAFVAMSFDPSRKKFYDGMNRAITDAGYLPIRIDFVEHINRIDDEITSQIRQSKFLVADLSGQRNGVYFEAGFMLGLGRPVIWACQKDELDKVHFDTRQYNTIDYMDADDLHTRLQFRIEAVLGKGPHRSA
jgi:nucleoside 2-deoxyribosyltransferase